MSHPNPAPDPSNLGGRLPWLPLGRLLVEAGHVTREQLASCLAEQDRSGKRLGEVVVERELISPRELAALLARQYGLEFVDLEATRIDEEAGAQLPEALARRYGAVAVSLLPGGSILLGVVDPSDLRGIDDLRLALGVNVKLGVVDAEQLEQAHVRLYRRRIQVVEGDAALGDAETVVDEVRDMASSAPTINLVNSIITRSVEEGASDIHFAPQRDALLVRTRVDGVLRDLARIPKHHQAAVASRLKIMGRLDIAERQLPQDGRVSVHFGGRPLDLRIAVMPTPEGEHIVLRLATRAQRLRGLAELGMSEKPFEAFSRAIHQPFGAVVVCGPTGSGKTTTLYAVLDELNDPGRMLMTIEDPIEHRVVGVNQIEVNPKRGLTFARGLRTMLRSDPDVLLVGEIRDEETAAIAMQAAMTGHLVLTSLHAQSAAGAVERLRDMGVESGRLASSLNCIVAQRLARRLCEACREPYEESAKKLGVADAEKGEKIQVYRPSGCVTCSGTGFSGRVALHEVLAVHGELRRLVAEGSEKTFATAVKNGMTTLRAEGLRLCREGVCSLDEIERATGDRLT